MSQIDRQDDRTNSQFMIKYSRKKTSASRLNPLAKGLLEKPREDNKFDTIAYLMHCPKHETIAVYQDPSSGIRWLPFTPLFPEKYNSHIHTLTNEMTN